MYEQNKKWQDTTETNKTLKGDQPPQTSNFGSIEALCNITGMYMKYGIKGFIKSHLVYI